MDIEKLIGDNPAITDIHVTEGEPVTIRLYGSLKPLKERAHDSFFSTLFEGFLGEEKEKEWETRGSCDGGATIDCPDRRNRLGHLGRIGAIICNALCSISSHNAPLTPFLFHT